MTRYSATPVFGGGAVLRPPRRQNLRFWSVFFIGLAWLGCIQSVLAATSIDLLTTVFGKEVVGTFSQNSSNPIGGLGNLGPILSRFIRVVLVFVLLLFFEKSLTWLIRTATEGTFLGKGPRKWWEVLRVLLGVISVIPLKFGFATIQWVALYVILIGCNIANGAWDVVKLASSSSQVKSVVGSVFSAERMVAPAKSAMDAPLETQLDALIAALVIAERHNEQLMFAAQNQIDRSEIQAWYYPSEDGNPYRQVPNYADLVWLDILTDAIDPGNPSSAQRFMIKLGRLGSDNDIDASYGRFSFDIADPVFLEMQYAALQNLLQQAIQIALDISNSPLQKRASWQRQMQAAVAAYMRVLDTIAQCISQREIMALATEIGLPSDNRGNNTCPKSIETKRTAKPKNYDWTGVGVYYFKGAIAGETIASSVNKITLGDPFGHKSENVLAKAASPKKSLQEINAGNGNTLASDLAIKNLAKKVEELNAEEQLKSWTARMVKKITTNNLEGKNPLAHMKSFGDGIIAAVAALWGAYAFTTALAEASVWTLLASPLLNVVSVNTSAIIVAIGSFGWSLMKTFGLALGSSLGGLTLLGGALAVYLPGLPFVFWVSALITWLLTSVAGVIGIPLAALSLISEDGEGLFPGRAREVLIILGSLLLRPILLVLGFLFSAAILEAGGAFINEVFFQLLDTIESRSSGGLAIDVLSAIPKLLFWVFMYFGLMVMLIHRAFEGIQWIPNLVLQKLQSHEPNHGGDERVYGIIATHFPRGIRPAPRNQPKRDGPAAPKQDNAQ